MTKTTRTLLLALATFAAIEQDAEAAPVDVTITLDQLTAVQTTERWGNNTRDEVYVAVAGKISTGAAHFARLPADDDYIGLHSGMNTQTFGWPNLAGGNTGTPVIWSGKLDNGQSAAFTVQLGEQDNKDVDTIKAISLAIVERLAGFIPLPYVGTVLSTLASVAQSIPVDAHDDMLGTFVVTVKNDNGTLSALFDPISTKDPVTTTVRTGTTALSATFTSFGTDASAYTYAVKVAKAAAPPRYLGVEFDQCGDSNLDVRDASGNVVRVSKGQTKTMPIALDGNGEFTWWCGGSREVTAPSWSNANFLEVRRSGTDRQITWSLYRR